MPETLGVPAHPGGLVVVRPELSVGIVQAVSRPTSFELELLARRPLDRRSATQRQADIRSGRAAPPAAPRRLLPTHDEGIDLRVGWLDRDGRAHWEFGSCSSSSGDHFGGTTGPSLRTVLRFPPLYDHASVVLAWPEIGFAETVLELDLPDRATVERGTVSIWDAPLSARPAPSSLRPRAGDTRLDGVPVEAGRLVAAPRVLSRGSDAAVVLSRLTAVGDALSMEILSVAEGAPAHAVSAAAFAPPARRTSSPGGPGAAVAVLHDGDAVWLEHGNGTSGGGGHAFCSALEFTLPHPGAGTLALLVSWPAAGLPDVCVDVPLRER